ncbi:efflux transporter outer membrane subunit [Panacibacter sp. DH6]|uniref:Efflux transporter outer membrane subunit n=1 Tax=Panacibacter microcysteis TaxID=2793269 RepID=A0A931H0J9_9BACT|nr:efflux transporter outer membrane subunit [Panacibacter microcysteis]MBG9378769.1 efflux transporter outer membrane subunit [Panacibacter microcysteis]
MKIILTCFTAIMFLLSACKVSKDIGAPTDAAPVAYRNADTTTTDTASIANIEWKHFFTDHDLQQLIDSSIANNYDMQVALKNIAAAQLVLKQSKLGYLPNVNLQANATINRPSDNSLNGISLSQFLGKSYVEDYTVSGAISWEADIWGKIKNQKEKALASFLQTGEARKVIQTNLVASVASGYYNLLMLDTQVAIAKKNLLLNDSTLGIIRLQYNAGEVTALAVQQATAQRLLAAQLIPQLEQEIAVQENALSLLAAVAPAAIKRNSGINNVQFTTRNAVGVPSALLQNRPDVKASELELAKANANTGIAKANMYPSLTITASGGLNAFKASNWFNIPASLFGAAAGSIAQPLFQRKQLKTQYELAKIDREKRVIEFRQSVLTAVGEVSDALVKVNKLEEQQSIAATRVDALQQAIGNADLLFKNGMANYLEVITAQSNVLQGELELAALKKEQLHATVELYRALGGGWK